MIYKFTISPEGGVGTPFRSDTLFGSACWTMLWYKGENALKEFLGKAEKGEPELVFSDGFPCGYLPIPFFVSLKEKDINTKDDYAKNKEEKKKNWFERSVFEKEGKLDENVTKKINLIKENVTHNIIDRFTGSSLKENGLFSQSKLWYKDSWEKVDIYVSTDWGKDKLSAFVEKMFEVGYGRDQSVGLGKIKILQEPVEDPFPQISSEYYLSLSRVVPCSEILLEESFYKIETKYGKVWKGLDDKVPFKKPIIQTIPGSVFKIKKSGLERTGRVLKNVHVNEKVLENCMGILYPLSQTLLKEYNCI